jgi:hypothetical protein
MCGKWCIFSFQVVCRWVWMERSSFPSRPTIYHLSHTHLQPPDDGLPMGPKRVEALSITDQNYALIIIPLFDTQAPTCFGIPYVIFRELLMSL